MYISCYIDLRISGIGLDLDKISNALKIKPNHSHKKGDKLFDRITSKEIEYTEDYWIYGVKTDEQQPVDLEIERFALRFTPYAAFFRKLSEESTITCWVSIFPEAEQCNIHLTRKTVEALHDIGATFDLSFAYLQTFYDGAYDINREGNAVHV